MARNRRSPGWFGPASGDPAEMRLRRRVVVLGMTAGLLAIVHVWIRVQVQDLSYRLHKTENVLHAIDIEHGELMAEEAHKSSHETIARAARSRFGLGTARPGQVISLERKDAKKP